jgi:hypothetical protein
LTNSDVAIKETKFTRITYFMKDLPINSVRLQIVYAQWTQYDDATFRQAHKQHKSTKFECTLSSWACQIWFLVVSFDVIFSYFRDPLLTVHGSRN